MALSTPKILALAGVGMVGVGALALVAFVGIGTDVTDADRSTVVTASDLGLGPCRETWKARVRFTGERRVTYECSAPGERTGVSGLGSASAPPSSFTSRPEGVAVPDRLLESHRIDGSTVGSAMLSFKSQKVAVAAAFRATASNGELIEDPLPGVKSEDCYHANLFMNDRSAAEVVIVRSGRRNLFFILRGFRVEPGRLVSAINERLARLEQLEAR